MDYFKIFNFNKEPFSNSPDPDFFFHSRQHVGYLQKLELAIHLRRGLNVIIGDVGTGKTTLCRQLIRKFADADYIQTYLLLDPFFNSSLEFLSTLTKMFGIPEPEAGATEWRFRELIKKYLFRQGVDKRQTVILIIDEGQKIPDFCLEILREFLNYEINEHKLLQIVIFAQKEFDQIIKKYANFADRINIRLFLGPLDFKETRKMIQFRLEHASEDVKPFSMFSGPALWAVYRATGGYPRKIINLCHQIMLALIIQNRSRAGWPLVHSCVKRISTGRQQRTQYKVAVAALVGIAAILVFVLLSDYLKTWLPWYDDSRTALIIASSENFAVHNKDEAVQKISCPVKNDAVKIDNLQIMEHKNQSTNQPVNQHKVFAESSDVAVFPLVLGTIRAKSGETVLEMIYKVYGLPLKSHLYKIILTIKQFNSQIDDLDTIYIGDLINFPAIPVTVSNMPEKGWWVEAIKCETLEDSYNFVRLYSSFNLRIFPYWNKREGMNFIVLVKNCFADEKSAQKAIDGLLEVVMVDAKMINQWDKDIVFFSNLPINQSLN